MCKITNLVIDLQILMEHVSCAWRYNECILVAMAHFVAYRTFFYERIV